LNIKTGMENYKLARGRLPVNSTMEQASKKQKTASKATVIDLAPDLTRTMLRKGATIRKPTVADYADMDKAKEEGLDEIGFTSKANLVLVKGETVVCAASYRLETKDNGSARFYVETLGTREGYKNQGYGSIMLRSLVHMASVHGCRDVRLGVQHGTNNQPAIQFYERHGFVLDSTFFYKRLSHDLAQKLKDVKDRDARKKIIEDTTDEWTEHFYPMTYVLHVKSMQTSCK
jgi:ribosomal protein S18 acetylase RimI-like enzyme